MDAPAQARSALAELQGEKGSTKKGEKSSPGWSSEHTPHPHHSRGQRTPLGGGHRRSWNCAAWWPALSGHHTFSASEPRSPTRTPHGSWRANPTAPQLQECPRGPVGPLEPDAVCWCARKTPVLSSLLGKCDSGAARYLLLPAAAEGRDEGSSVGC